MIKASVISRSLFFLKTLYNQASATYWVEPLAEEHFSSFLSCLFQLSFYHLPLAWGPGSLHLHQHMNMDP